MPEGAAGTGHHPVPIPAPDLTAWTRAMCLRGISLNPRTSRVLGALESLGSKRCSVNPKRFIPKLGGRGWRGDDFYFQPPPRLSISSRCYVLPGLMMEGN